MLNLLRIRLVPFMVALVAAMFAIVCQSRPLGFFVFGLALLISALGPMISIEPTSQAGLSFVALVVGVLLPRALAVEHPSAMFLSDRTVLIACPALLIAATRGFIKSPTGGAPLTIALTIVALAGSGRAISSVYGPIVVAASLLGIVGLAAGDPARPWPKQINVRDIGKVLLALGVSALFATSVSRTLPILHDAIIERITGPLEQRSGFSTSMELTALDGMLQSDEVVVRVRGGAPTLLRGAIFDQYVRGLWSDPTNGANRTTQPTETSPPKGEGYVELEFPRRPERYFLPADATDVRTSLGVVHTSPDGIRSPVNELYAKRVWYKPGDTPNVPGPRPDDLRVPERVRTAIEPYALSLGGGGSDLEKLKAIQSHLQHDYSYSLEFKRTPGVDPIVDFLTVHKEGHCEYFASAMALLARVDRIPARVVTGYRVVEGSSLGDYQIVRERNAHAWVEAWVEDRWQTFDPTPASAFIEEEHLSTPFGVALADLLSTSWEKVDDFLAVRTPFELSFALVGLVGLLFAVRLVGRRRTKVADTTSSVEPPLPSYVELQAALSKRGLVRASHETLSAFADRIAKRAIEETDLCDATEAVRRYAKLRYGGGDEGVVTREIAGVAAALRRAS